jgi:acyl carrier protein
VIARTRALAFMQETLDGLHSGGLVAERIQVTEDTRLLGSGSSLDSIGFVTFITDLEERLTTEAKRDVPLLFNELHEFNAGNPHLSAGVLARYIESITSKP